MNVGDLVQMKYRMFWVAKNNKHMTYTELPCLVIETFANAIKVIYADGLIKTDFLFIILKIVVILQPYWSHSSVG